MSNRGMKYNVLFLGSGNAARSIMAEAILRRDGGEKFQAYSAGLHAKEALDPHAAELLRRAGFDIAVLRPQNWNELAGDDGVRFDFIFTVCDNAMLLPRSMWPGRPLFAHWGVANPAMTRAGVAEIRCAYSDTFRILANRVGMFTALALASLDRPALQRELDLIGSSRDKAVVAAA
ncbi:MAG: arsenate reductase ArsC [Pseudolabrys sp.]